MYFSDKKAIKMIVPEGTINASMKKFVCLCVPKPNSITLHMSDSEHPTPLATFPRGAGCINSTLYLQVPIW